MEVLATQSNPVFAPLMNEHLSETSVSEFESSEDRDILLEDALLPLFQEHGRNELRRSLSEAEVLFAENRWEDLVALFHPLEERVPDVVAAGLDLPLRLKVGFSLGQLERFDDALFCMQSALPHHPDDFLVHSTIAYTAYQSLLAAQNRRILLTPDLKKDRIELAHHHFKQCRRVRPDGVTNSYREAMLFKQVERKMHKAIPLFLEAIANWESRTDQQKERRHQERPKYIRALYHLASSLLDTGNPRKAVEMLSRCMEQDAVEPVMAPLFKHFTMGKILYALGRYPESLEYLEAAAALASKGQPVDFVWELAARCALALKDPARGIHYIEQIPDKKRRAYVRWTESDALAALGRNKEAENILISTAQRDHRSRHKALLRLAQLYYRQGNLLESLEKARQASRFCLDTFGNEWQEAIFWETGCLYRLGHLDMSLERMGLLKRLNPHYPHLQRLEDKIRRAKENV